jgi:hypothetical protein
MEITGSFVSSFISVEFASLKRFSKIRSAMHSRQIQKREYYFHVHSEQYQFYLQFHDTPSWVTSMPSKSQVVLLPFGIKVRMVNPRSLWSDLLHQHGQG